MIYLICGEKNEGKTTRLKEIFCTVKNAYGFAADKQFDGDTLIAYNLLNLRSGASITLARIRTATDESAAENLIQASFCFNTSGFAWAEEVFEDALKAGADAFFLDEVGRIELGARGHSKLVHRALNSNMDIYMTVRNSNLKDIVRMFGIKEYTRIKVR